MTGDFEAVALYRCRNQEESTLTAAADRLDRVVTDAAAVVESGAERAHESAALASPMCFADEMDEAQMGYASRDALLAALNELLETERSGAQVTSQTAAAMTDTPAKAIVTSICRDEARWCNVLTVAIMSLHATPTRCTEAFYEKAMAIGDLSQRSVS